MNVSCVVPCYNCEEYVKKNILKLYNRFKILKVKFELVLVDDHSNDATYIKINELKKKLSKIKIIKNSINSGKSFSLIKGIKASKYNHIVIIDCDLPYFNSISQIIKNLKKNDMVIINRRLPNSKLAKGKLNFYQFGRNVLGERINDFLRFWFKINIKDTQAGLKGFIKPRNFSKIKFISKRFFFDLELILLFLSRDKKILSLKTVFKTSKKSTINFMDFKRNFETFFELIKVCICYK